MHHDERLGASPVQLRVGVELWDVDHGEARDVVLGRGPIRPDEDLPGEQIVPGILRHDPDRDPMGGVDPCKAVLHVDVASLQIGEEPPVESVEAGRIEGAIDRSPPDPILGGGLLHHELVIGRPARILTSSHDQGSAGCQQTFAPPDGVLDEGRRAQVPIGLIDVKNSVLL